MLLDYPFTRDVFCLPECECEGWFDWGSILKFLDLPSWWFSYGLGSHGMKITMKTHHLNEFCFFFQPPPYANRRIVIIWMVTFVCIPDFWKRIPRGAPKVESQETNPGIMPLRKLQEFEPRNVGDINGIHPVKKLNYVFRNYPTVSWPLKTSYFEDLYTPAIQVHSPFHWRVQWPVRDSDCPDELGMSKSTKLNRSAIQGSQCGGEDCRCIKSIKTWTSSFHHSADPDLRTVFLSGVLKLTSCLLSIWAAGW